MRYILLMFLLVGCMPKPQDKCGFVQDVWEQRLIWKKFPIQIVSMDSMFDTPLRKAMSTWNEEAGFTLFEFGSDGFEVKFQDPWEYNNKNAQAVTYIFWQSSRIDRFHIIVNPFVTQGTVDMESLFLHELGHTLGLDHSVNKTSVMYPSLSYYQIRRELSDEDRSNFKCGYSVKLKTK